MSTSRDNLDQLGAYLVLPPSLRDAGMQRLYGWLIYVIVALVAGIIAWSAFAQMREMAVAAGEIVSSQFVQPVHHLEGGIIEAIFVAEGQVVTPGTPLLRLRPEGADSDLQQLRSRRALLDLRQIELSAMIEDREPVFGDLAKEYPDLAAGQFASHRQSRSAWQSERQQLLYAIQQAEGALNAALAQLESAQLQIAIEREQTEIRARSFKLGYTSRIAWLEAKSRLEAANAKLAGLKADIQKLETQREEARGALRKAEDERLLKLTDERAKVGGELGEVTTSLVKHQDRVARLVVVAPTAGTINVLPHKSPGAVLKPGDLVAEIVSLQAGVIAEVQMKARDSGHVKVGDAAEIRVSNFDPSVMGLAHGEVIDISPTTFKPERGGEPYYRTRIRLGEDRLGNGAQQAHLLPGMMIEAHIVTGSKSLFWYMLKPIARSLDVAFSER
jgi:membrane fusion protein, adhesin transport system